MNTLDEISPLDIYTDLTKEATEGRATADTGTKIDIVDVRVGKYAAALTHTRLN